jgi:hypothetical protein
MTINYDLLLDWDGLAEAGPRGPPRGAHRRLSGLGGALVPSPFRMSGGTGSIR